MRLLTKSDAAEYCRLSVETFNRLCPVRPIALQPGNRRLLRYDKNDLDTWIEGLKTNGRSDGSGEPTLEDYLARLDP